MKPLTLKKQALLYVVCNLEHFNHEALKAIPEKLRRELLVNLPPIDICRLEAAGVGEGEKPHSVWDDIAINRMPHNSDYELDHNIAYQVYYDDWKAYYFAIVLHALLNRVKPVASRSHYEFVLHLLLGVRDCVGITDWTKYRFSYFAPIVNDRPLIPNRHLRHLATKRSETSFLEFILEFCPYRPKVFWIVCDRFGETDVYRKHANDVLSRVMCKAEKVIITFDYDTKDGVFRSVRDRHQRSLPYDVTSLILKMIISHDSPVLTSIEFRYISVQMLDEVLKISAPLFYASLGKASKNIPYRGLRDIFMEVVGPAQCPSNELLQKLGTIIKNQTALEKLTIMNLVLEKSYLNEQYLKFVSSLSTFVKKVHFKSLVFRRMFIAIEGVQNVVDAFLAAPSYQRQSIRLDRVTIVGQPSREEAARKIPMHPDSQKYKALELFSSDIPFGFFRWLFSHHQMWLHGFEVCHCKLLTQSRDLYDEDQKAENVVHMLATSPDLRVERIDLNSMNLLHCRTSVPDFETIFSNPVLQSICLRSCKIGHHGLLPDITKALKKQIEIGKMESLSLISNDLGDVPYEELQDLLDVVFSFPQMEAFDFSISHNDFEERHFHMLYDTWKRKCNGKQLRVLTCIRGDYPRRNKEMGMKLDEMAVRCYHM